MNEAEGRTVGQNALDAIAVAEERSPGCRLLAVQTTLVVRERDGGIRVLTAMKERKR